MYVFFQINFRFSFNFVKKAIDYNAKVKSSIHETWMMKSFKILPSFLFLNCGKF